jgi:general secretion pathway protein D
MKIQSKSNANSSNLKKLLIIALSIYTLVASDCDSITLTTAKNSKIITIIEDFSTICKFSIIQFDEKTQKALNKKLHALYIKDKSLDELFGLLLNKNNIDYTFNDNSLSLNYLITKSYNIDYIATNRSSKSNTDIVMMTKNSSMYDDTSPNTTVGATIKSGDSFNFFNKNFSKRLYNVLKTPQDKYKPPKIIINKEAGLITVTATYNQHKRLQDYLKKLKSKIQSQVLIDLKIYNVELGNNNKTGIDWAKIGSVFDINASLGGDITSPTINLGSSINLGSLLAFLKTTGAVESISNPKILTLNNQPAIISVGKEIYYKLTQSVTTTATSTTTQNSQSIQSIFAGILLDITPSISQDGYIILKINPSVSSIADITKIEDKTIPPDLNKKQISSVIRLKDKDTIILGGLIDTQKNTVIDKIPFLGDIWLLGWFFKSKKEITTTKELVIVITPHIIKNSTTYHDNSYKKIDILTKDNILK